MPRGRPFRVVVALLLLAAATIAPQSLAFAQDGPDGTNDQNGTRVIVVFHDWVPQPAQAAQQMSRAQNARLLFVYENALRGFVAEVPSTAVAAFARDARVAYVEEDQIVYAFNDIPTGVDRIEADKNGTGGVIGSGKVVDVDIAILDTGIDHNHPDLKVVGGADCTVGGIFIGSCSTGLPGDVNGHGTHVAGTAAALDNGSAVVGVAPGARLYAVKVLRDGGSGWMSGIVAGIDWVTARADVIEVANMSLGCECTSAALDQALTNSTNAGVVYVVAAGNSAKDASTFSPANHPRTIATSAMADFDGKAGGVAATTCRNDVGQDDTFASFSNFGSTVNLAAPGVCINSTMPGGGYAMLSGTSMASPHVAGAAALYVVEHNVPKSGNRWQVVRDGMVAGWSTPQADPCGFTGGKSSEPMLMLAECDTAGADPGDPGDPAVGSVSGTVTAESGGAISGATVSIPTLGLTSTTGGDGSFAFTEVPAGEQEVHVEADGYEPASQVVSVPDGGTVTADFTLTPLSPPSEPGQLFVTVTTNKSVYQMNETVRITVVVQDENDGAVSAASVSFQITTASGRNYSGSATTDSDGAAVLDFKIKRPDGWGTYSVSASASLSGYQSGAGSTTFVVQ
jgi:subtilisin family serine protease